jgi:nucleoside-diphosphate kinase
MGWPADMIPQERAFVMIKPDGVHRGQVGSIISRFETRGFKLLAMSVRSPSRALLEAHYADLREKTFFPCLIEYMLSGPVCTMVWAGDGVILTGRKLLGATKPSDSAPGTIRGDGCIDVGRNVCHGSDSVDSAEKEVELWFPTQGAVVG